MNILKISNIINSKSFIKFIKSFFVAFIIFFLTFTAYIANVRNEQKLSACVHDSLQLTPVIQLIEKPKKQIQKELAIDKATEIIIRDGKNIHESIARKYATWIYASGEKHKVNPILILSVMSVESNFNANARSPTGPIGLLQVAYTHHKEKTTRAGLYDAKNNIDVGARILAEYKGANDTKTLNRYYGGSVSLSNAYARKVISYKNKYEKEILKAVSPTEI